MEPGFGAGGLRTPSPTPIVAGWETEDGGRWGQSARDVKPKVTRVAEVDTMSEKMVTLRLKLKTVRGECPVEHQLDNFVWKSGLSELQQRVLRDLIDEMVEERTIGERERCWQVEDTVLESGRELGTVVTRLVVVEAE